MAKKNAASKRQAKEIAHARAPEVSEADALEPVQEEVRRTLLGSAEREEAARELREFIWKANSALVERLLSVWNDQKDPGLSQIDNERRRYARILWAMSAYFHAIGRDKLPALGTYIGSLGVALEDLIRGVTDPLFVTKGSKRDSMRIWGARMQAALGLECFIQSGLSRERAASEAATKYEALTELIRIAGSDLKGSLLSWYDSYIKRRVPVPELLEAFQETHRAIKAAKLSRAKYRRIGHQYFKQAVQSSAPTSQSRLQTNRPIVLTHGARAPARPQSIENHNTFNGLATHTIPLIVVCSTE